MPKSRPPYPTEFRQQIIELARDRGKPLPGREGLTGAEREELVRPGITST